MSNTATVITFTSGSPYQTNAVTNGDSYQIVRVAQCVDQPGRGAGVLLSGTTPSPTGSVAEILDPIYEWNDTLSSGSLNQGVVSPNNTSSIIANRDWYAESKNQASQTTASSPFGGTSGTGHGTLANGPTTCTTGVGYAEYASGSFVQLDICTGDEHLDRRNLHPVHLPAPARWRSNLHRFRLLRFHLRQDSMKTALLLLLGASSSYAVCTITVTSPSCSPEYEWIRRSRESTPFTFTASLSGCPTVQKVGYAVDGYSLYNSGIDGAPLGSTYANGSTRCGDRAWILDHSPVFGSLQHVLVRQFNGTHRDRDSLRCEQCRSGHIERSHIYDCEYLARCMLRFNCTRSSMTFGSVSSGILPVTWTVTGSCATDSKAPQPQIFVDGVNQTLDGSFTSTNATETFNLDETRWLNGTHVICWGWQDATDKTTYSGTVVVDSAGEQCDPSHSPTVPLRWKFTTKLQTSSWATTALRWGTETHSRYPPRF